MTVELAPFAGVEARLATDTMRMLANAVARTQAGGEFAVIFDAVYVSPLGDIDSVGPVATALDADLQTYAIVQGSALTIRGTAYEVRKPEPDGTGCTVLRLRLGTA